MLTPFRDDLSFDREALGPLVDFYLEAGASGLLAACWSSETEFMDFSELLTTVAATVSCVGGRVPVAATPHAGDNLKTRLEWRVGRLFELGADIVVLIANRFAREEESEKVLIERMLRATDAAPGGCFGVYESPSPYHRRLSPEGIRRIADTGRFVFHKDTSCNWPVIRSKVSAIEGTPLRFFNAHSPTLLDSLLAGGSGYSGIGANFFPEVYADLCRNARRAPDKARALQQFLDRTESWSGNDGYPKNAKMFLAELGVPIKPFCRIPRHVTREQQGFIAALMEAYRQLQEDFFPSFNP